MKKNYTPEFKAKVVMELFREELTLTQLAAGYGIHPNLVSKWKTAAVEGLPELLADRRKRDKAASEQEEFTKDLYAQIGELTTKLAWLKKNLALTFSRSQRLDMLELNGDFSITQQCELLSLNRTSLYYKPRPIGPTKLAILHAIDEIFTEDPAYGARRIRNELLKRGFSISRPTVAEYMLTLGLAAIYPKPNTSRAQGLSVLAPEHQGFLPKPHRGDGHHLYPNAERIHVFGGFS